MPVVQNPSIGAGAQPMLVTTTQISSAQILAMFLTPVQLIPAPGPGFLIIVFGLAITYKFGTVAYECASDALAPWYHSTEDGVVGNNITGMVAGFTQGRMSYTPGNTLGGDPISPGEDNKAVELGCNSSYDVGPIVTATLGAGGLGYAANDTGTITTGNGDATYKVLTVGAGGAVLTFQITAPGTLYATGNGNATVDGGAQPGVGVGLTVNITAVQTGDGTLKVVTYYQIIPVP